MQKISNKTKDYNLQDFVDYYMYGNLRRFLRKHKNQYYNQLVYSVTLKHIKKNHKKAYNKILSFNLWPKDMVNLINVFITLDKKFGIGFTINTLKDYLLIEEELTDIIHDYMYNIYMHRYKSNPRGMVKHWLDKKKALKEQKARGFVNINDFEEFNPKSSHIVSTIDKYLYYPINIHPHNRPCKEIDDYNTNDNPYILGTLIAVEGYTRIVVNQ